MRHSFLDRYRQANSLVHRLDPRLKLLTVLAFVSVTTSTSPRAWPRFLLLAVLALATIRLARLPLGQSLRRSAIALPFAGMVALSLFFSQAGQALWSWRVLGCELTVTNEGMLLFVSVAVKSWLSVLVSGLLVATTRWPDLLLALRSMRLPTVLINTLALMVRYLGVLVDEALRMQAARDSRSAGPGRSVIWRARVLGGMIGSLFIRSLERSERIYAAMLARGFAGELRSLTRLSWRARDTWAGMACSLALLSAVLIGRAWR